MTTPTPETPTPYRFRWEITIQADDPRGAMDAVWKMWEAWRDGNEPKGYSCPASMGNRVMASVKITTQ